MKQVVKLTGCIALMAVIGLALSCKQEEKEDLSSTLSVPDISSTPDFPKDVEFVSSYYEALTLFNSVKSPLGDQLAEAFNDAIAAAFTKDQVTVTGPGENRSVTLRLPNGYSIPAIPGATIDNGISSGTYSNSGWEDSRSTGKRSGSATFNITRFTAAGESKLVPGGSIPPEYIIDDTIQAAGVVKASGRSDYENRRDMVNDVDLGEKQSDEVKYAFALTVVGPVGYPATTKAAKFRFAYTKNTSDNNGKSGRNFLETTTVEVYNRSDTKVYELNEVRSSGFDSLASYIDDAAFNVDWWW
jgi:hypothetical protein